MKRRIASLLLAGCICCTSAAVIPSSELSADALTLIAYVTKVSAFKDTIAVGEQIQLDLEWSNGAQQMLFFRSSDDQIAVVNQAGVVTGISEGTVTITVSHSQYGTDQTLTLQVSGAAAPTTIWQTSELKLGDKLLKNDILHYDNQNIGTIANIVNTKGSFDLAWLSEDVYILPFDAEIVGFDGGTIYIAPDIEGITYLDGRTLQPGDVIDTDAHLLCYDYCVNDSVHPVFLPKYYKQLIGEGTIRVQAIDHENKTITLKAVPAVEGDLDADGLFDVIDVILLQKWLLSVPDTVIPDTAPADLNGDGTVDVFDLCLMKRALLESAVVIDYEPVFICKGSRIGCSEEKGWYSTPYITEINAEGLEQYPEITALLDKIEDKEAQLRDAQMVRIVPDGWCVEDYGEDELYLREFDFLLCRFGEECEWLDDPDVQELVKLLVDHGIYSNADMFHACLNAQ